LNVGAVREQVGANVEAGQLNAALQHVESAQRLATAALDRARQDAAERLGAAVAELERDRAGVDVATARDVASELLAAAERQADDAAALQQGGDAAGAARAYLEAARAYRDLAARVDEWLIAERDAAAAALRAARDARRMGPLVGTPRTAAPRCSPSRPMTRGRRPLRFAGCGGAGWWRRTAHGLKFCATVTRPLHRGASATRPARRRDLSAMTGGGRVFAQSAEPAVQFGAAAAHCEAIERRYESQAEEGASNGCAIAGRSAAPSSRRTSALAGTAQRACRCQAVPALTTARGLPRTGGDAATGGSGVSSQATDVAARS
jgi:hypothetical protein